VGRLQALAAMLSLLSLLLGCSREPPFVRDAGGWRYRGHPIDVDAASFRPLGMHHGRDATQVVFADTRRDSRDYFTTTRLVLVRIAGADLASFVLLDDEHARDAKRIYHRGRPLAVKDPASFELLHLGGFARDRVVGYWQQQPVSGSDGATFAAASSHHAKDSRRVWWCDFDHSGEGPAKPRCRALLHADPADFEPLERGYARSGVHVFHEAAPVPGADAASFAVDNSYSPGFDAHDGRRRYQAGRPAQVAATAP